MMKMRFDDLCPQSNGLSLPAIIYRRDWIKKNKKITSKKEKC